MLKINMDYNSRDHGFSGLPTLTSDLIPEYNNLYAIVNQGSVEPETPFQIVVLDETYIGEVMSDNFTDWEKAMNWLKRRGISIDENSADVKKFLRGE